MKPETRSALERVFTRLELQLMAVAEEMPEDKYSFRPSTGESGDVRTFGEQLRHVAAVQWVVGAALLGEEPPVDVGDDGPIGMTSKEDILKYVKESFAYIGRAVAGINDDTALEIVAHPYDPERTKLTRLALATGYACHGWEHYGQMVVYQRLNGIVPPPSRPQGA